MKPKKSWDKKWYTDEFLQQLKQTARTEYDGNLPMVVKHAPDAVSPIGIDPRVLGGQIGKTAKVLAVIPDFLTRKMGMKLDEKGLADFRKKCSQVASAVCVKQGVDMQDMTVPATDGYPIPIRLYKNALCQKGSPCLYFIHGGGFIGGGIAPYDEAWKVFVTKFNLPVISVEYRLMPENPYPIPHDDCWQVLQWICQNSEQLGIDPTRIFVAGDSAGGNLAQSCATRAKGSDMVRGQIILYGSLNLFRIEDEYYRLDGKNFVFEPTQKRLSRCIVKQLEMMCKNDDLGIATPDPYINPYTYDAGGNPPTLITVGDLDFLKNDNIAWAHKLQDAGVSVEVVKYNGMGHGYLNAVGVFPQAEDFIDHMGDFINRHK